MRINNIGNVNLLPNNINLENKKLNIPEEKIVIPSEIFIKSEIEDTILLYSKLTIENLEILPDTLFNNLKDTVTELLKNQMNAINSLNPENLLELDEVSIAKILTLIEPNGKLSIEVLSDSIIELTQNILHGENKQQPETLKEVIIKVFNEAEKTLGKLPDVSLKTRDKTMEKLNKLITEMKNPFNSLKQMVKEMIVKQVQEFQVLDQKDLVEVNVSTIAEALELISPDGELGIEKLSNSIVDFAKKISGGDKTKLETLKEEIVKGFTETERILGKLPDISIKTRYKILEKLDTWEYGWIQRTMLNLQNPILPEKIKFFTLTPKILTPIILTGILVVIIFISLR
jgi:DNA-directed RNA polymerase subunit F